MSLKTLSLLAIMSLFIAACGDTNTSETSADAADAETIDAAIEMEPIQDAFNTEPVSGANYGAGVAADAAVVAYPAFIAAMENRDSLTAALEAEVIEVCQAKGCWMTVRAAGDENSEMTVRFKDYGFFMPKTLSGSKVVMQGTAKRRMVPVDELQHYAEDAGKSAEEIAAITEPKEELEFTATGVRVL
jgi:hypothetical protein